MKLYGCLSLILLSFGLSDTVFAMSCPIAAMIYNNTNETVNISNGTCPGPEPASSGANRVGMSVIFGFGSAHSIAVPAKGQTDLLAGGSDFRNCPVFQFSQGFCQINLSSYKNGSCRINVSLVSCSGSHTINITGCNVTKYAATGCNITLN